MKRINLNKFLLAGLLVFPMAMLSACSDEHDIMAWEDEPPHPDGEHGWGSEEEEEEYYSDCESDCGEESRAEYAECIEVIGDEDDCSDSAYDVYDDCLDDCDSDEEDDEDDADDEDEDSTDDEGDEDDTTGHDDGDDCD